MATIAQPAVRIRRDRLFYTSMGLAIAAVTFWGFAASFYLSPWLTPPATTPRWSSLLYVHAGLFTAWMALMISQPLLIAARGVALHRRIGLAGAGLAAAMVLIGNWTAVGAMDGGFIGMGDPLRFYAVPFFAINSFAVAVFFAILWRNRAETHKRLILLANVGLLGAAIARIPIDALQAGAPFTFLFLPNFVTVAGILYDWRTRRRVHKVWIWGGLAMLISQIVVGPVMASDWWHAFAGAMAALG